MTRTDEPADLAGFRARREELKRERRRQKARDNLTRYAPDYGREIPPRLNPDIPDMVDQIKSGYTAVEADICDFQSTIDQLCVAGKLDPEVARTVSEYLTCLADVLGDNTACAVRDWDIAGFDVHLATDKVKYAYAIGAREIAFLQYFFAEKAGTGRLDPAANHHLQWNHCATTWQDLYDGTLRAVRDGSCWDGMWDWHANTYSDGRQIITWIELLPREFSACVWPQNGHLCGDGPIQEFPLGTICHIAPVEDGYKDYPLIKAHLPECLWLEIARQHPGTLWHDGQPVENV